LKPSVFGFQSLNSPATATVSISVAMLSGFLKMNVTEPFSIRFGNQLFSVESSAVQIKRSEFCAALNKAKINLFNARRDAKTDEIAPGVWNESESFRRTRVVRRVEPRAAAQNARSVFFAAYGRFVSFFDRVFSVNV
jgi:hypothetical protein